MKAVSLVAINRSQELAILNCGCAVKMQNFIDRFGDDTDDVNEAISAIAPHGGKWLVIDFSQFETVARH